MAYELDVDKTIREDWGKICKDIISLKSISTFYCS